MSKREKIVMGIKHTKEKFDSTTKTLLIGAFAFVAALFWNDAVRSAIETFLPPQNNVVYKFTAAIIVTALAIAVTYIVRK